MAGSGGVTLLNAVVPDVSALDPLMRRVHVQPLNPVLAQAVVEHEDRRFYQHGGLDLPGLLRAVWSSVSGGPLEGGSAVMQQLVKNTLLVDQHGARTLKHKEQEAWLAQQVISTSRCNNMVEQFHRHTRRQERQHQGFKRKKRAQEFLHLHARIENLHQHS